MKVSREGWIALGLLLIAVFIRVWCLDIKPPHFDEGINGHFVSEMWKAGYYKYDPTNFHGPFFFYFLQLGELLLGRGIIPYRLVTILFSVATCALILMHRRFFGRSVIWAAVVMVLSPASVFYARYAIHESLFILLQVLFSYGFFLWHQRPSKTALSLMVLGVAGAFAVKETFFIYFVTWGIAVYSVRFFDAFRPGRFGKVLPENPRVVEGPDISDIIAICFLGGLGVLAVFSGFFMHLEGLVDMVRAFAFWTKTGTASSGHDKPFYYWLRLLWIYEWPALVALCFTPVIYFAKELTSNARIMILTAFGTWLAYSLIPYKTPWLILNLLWPLSFVLGFAIEWIWSLTKSYSFRRYLFPSFVTLLLAVSSVTMLRLNFRDYTNPKDPYVYVQSTLQFYNVMRLIDEHVKLRPEDINIKVIVANKDTWPMPWTLSDFTNLAWTKLESADVDGAAIVLIDASSKTELEAKLKGKYWVEPFQIRDAYNDGWAYFNFAKFSDVIPAGTPIFESSTAKVGLVQ